MNGGYPFAPPHRQGRAPWQASSPSPAGCQRPRPGLRPTAVAWLRSADLPPATVSTWGCLTARNTARTPLPGGRRLAPHSAGSRGLECQWRRVTVAGYGRRAWTAWL